VQKLANGTEYLMESVNKCSKSASTRNCTVKMSRKMWVLSLLALAALQLHSGSEVAAHLNVFLNPVEVMRLLGEFRPLSTPFPSVFS